MAASEYRLPPLPRPIRQRLADVIAAQLRRQILSGDLPDGALLPSVALLSEHFGVSIVPLRESLRILETEGLISVRRGNRGGVVVHAAANGGAAYGFGVLLQSQEVTLSDLGAALQTLEPICAAFGARRPDRGEQLVDGLCQLNDAAAAAIDDGPVFAIYDSGFHELLARCCGNRTFAAVVGSLQALWTSHDAPYADLVIGPPQREATLQAHRRLTEAIAQGDSDRSRTIAASHLIDCEVYVADNADHRRIIARSAQDHRDRVLRRPMASPTGHRGPNLRSSRRKFIDASQHNDPPTIESTLP